MQNFSFGGITRVALQVCTCIKEVSIEITVLLSTVEARITETVFIRTLRLNFHFLNPLNKNSKEAATGNCSYVIGFMSFDFEIQE